MNRRQAPSVCYPVGPCVLYGGLLLGTWLLGAAVLLGHAWQAGQVSVVGGLLLAAAGALAVRAWRLAPVGALCWAGADGWIWRTSDAQQALPVPALVWRGRHHLLLQLATGPRGLKWLWIERGREPRRWDAICRAAQAR